MPFSKKLTRCPLGRLDGAKHNNESDKSDESYEARLSASVRSSSDDSDDDIKFLFFVVDLGNGI